MGIRRIGREHSGHDAGVAVVVLRALARFVGYEFAIEPFQVRLRSIYYLQCDYLGKLVGVHLLDLGAHAIE